MAAERNGHPTLQRAGATPVPIPNTEVKPCFGDGTAGYPRWESSARVGPFWRRRWHGAGWQTEGPAATAAGLFRFLGPDFSSQPPASCSVRPQRSVSRTRRVRRASGLSVPASAMRRRFTTLVERRIPRGPSAPTGLPLPIPFVVAHDAAHAVAYLMGDRAARERRLLTDRLDRREQTR